MKVCVMTKEQARHFYGVLANPTFCPTKSMLDMRKITKVFDALEDIVKEYEKKLVKIQEEYGVKEVPTSTGVQIIIPPENQEIYQEKKDRLDEMNCTIFCDRESLAFAEDLYVKVPERSTQPLGGRYNSRLFPEVEDALRSAKEQESDQPKKKNS